MANIDDELLADAAEDARMVKHLQAALPQRLKETFDEDTLYYFLDCLIDYYAETGVLDAEPDKDGYVEIAIDPIAEYIVKMAQKEKIGSFDPEDVALVVEAHLSFDEENQS